MRGSMGVIIAMAVGVGCARAAAPTDAEIDSGRVVCSGGRCFDPSAGFGDPCLRLADCSELEICFDEATTGIPGGICARDCAAEPASCDATLGEICSVLVLRDGTASVCLPECAPGVLCREGFACRGDDGATAPLSCRPDCTLDPSACTVGRTCGPDGTCS